jgi:endonuclease-3 related protein
LRAFLSVIVGQYGGDLPSLLHAPTSIVRQRLLSIHGIGPETADCILLYASSHESFVIDAYTRRILVRHGWAVPEMTYTDLQRHCELGLGSAGMSSRLGLWRDAHAQLVMVGKQYCRRRVPRCPECPLRCLLPKGLPLPM